MTEPISQQPVSEKQEAMEMHERVWISHRAFYLTEPPIGTDPGKGTYYHRDDLCVSRAGTEVEVNKAVWNATHDFRGVLNELQRSQICRNVIENLRAAQPDSKERK